MKDDRPEAVGMSTDHLAGLGDAFRAGVDRGEIPGAVLVVGRRGRIVQHEAIGYRDREAGAVMPQDAIFRLSSMTKPIISLAAMMLVEDARLRLDAPVGMLMPMLAGMKVATVSADGSVTMKPPARPIMLLDLLRHTSGITAGHHGTSPVKRLYTESGVGLPLHTRADYLAKLGTLPLEFEPGSTFAYGLSHDVVGHIVEEVSGQPLDRFLRTRITEPLGMTDTVFQVPESARHRIAEPQIDAATGARPQMRDPLQQPTRLSGQGNLLSTVSDWARLCQCMLDGGMFEGRRLVSRKTVELMVANHLPPGVAFDPALAAGWGPALPSPAFGHGFGFGLSVRTAMGRASWHGSVGDFGWVGSTGVYFWVDPREQLFAVLFMQAPMKLVPYLYVLRSRVYGALTD
jgi:CubicO group peptidase (beta-lactamase class C family)